jgi:hypothetical protein
MRVFRKSPAIAVAKTRKIAVVKIAPVKFADQKSTASRPATAEKRCATGLFLPLDGIGRPAPSRGGAMGLN